jgi:hypothetical protein
MTFILTKSLFTNGIYELQYGLKKAVFTLLDEVYSSGGNTARVNRVICSIQSFSSTGEKSGEEFGSLVIGLGDTNISVTTNVSSLLGKLMTEDTMADCVVELYE